MKHLHELSPEQKTHLLAELDGFEQRTTAIWVNKDESKKFWYFFNQHGEMEFSSDAPKYLTSYDAIIPLVQKLGKNVACKAAECCIKHHGFQDYIPSIVLLQSPSQLCNAVLVATGKAIFCEN